MEHREGAQYVLDELAKIGALVLVPVPIQEHLGEDDNEPVPCFVEVRDVIQIDKGIHVVDEQIDETVYVPLEAQS